MLGCWRIDYVACWRTGHGGHRPTEICHANHSRTRASVPCSPAPHLSAFIQTKKVCLGQVPLEKCRKHRKVPLEKCKKHRKVPLEKCRKHRKVPLEKCEKACKKVKKKHILILVTNILQILFVTLPWFGNIAKTSHNIKNR